LKHKEFVLFLILENLSMQCTASAKIAGQKNFLLLFLLEYFDGRHDGY